LRLTPLELLMKMLNDGFDNAKQTASDTKTTSEQLEQLYEAIPKDNQRTNDYIRRNVAEISQKIAINPNTPIWILMELEKKNPEAIIANPQFNSLRQENSENYFVKLSLARSLLTSEEVLGNLTEDYISDLSLQYHDEEDFEQELFYALIRNSNIPLKALLLLLEHQPSICFVSHNKRWALVNYPNTPTAILEELGQYFPEAIVNHPAFISTLKTEPNSYFVKLSLARSKTTPEENLVKLAKECSTCNLWQEQDKCRKLKAALAANPNIPTELLTRWVNDFQAEADTNIYRAIISNTNTPRDLLEKVCELCSTYLFARELINNPHTPTWILEQLASHSIQEYRLQVLEHINVSAKVIATVKFLEEELIPSSDFWHELIDNSNEYLRSKVAQNIYCPPEILEQLAKDEKEKIRRAVAINQELPINLIAVLADDESEYVRTSLARNRNNPLPILEKLARDSSPDVRLMVNNNRNIPLELLKVLIEDSDGYVRQLAQCRYQQKLFTLKNKSE
jgi:hypothetical protein